MRKNTQRGLTMVEVVLSSLIVGGMVVASLDTVGAVYRNQRINASRQIAAGLAHELMSEVMSMPYGDPDDGAANGTETGETSATRADFDDVDDYKNWDEPDSKDKAGNALAGYTGWRRQVAMTWTEPLFGLPFGLSDTGIRRITVTVTDPAGVQTQLLALRHKDGSLEQESAIDMTAINWIGGELQLGSSPIVARHGTQLTNHASDSN